MAKAASGSVAEKQSVEFPLQTRLSAYPIGGSACILRQACAQKQIQTQSPFNRDKGRGVFRRSHRKEYGGAHRHRNEGGESALLFGCGDAFRRCGVADKKVARKRGGDGLKDAVSCIRILKMETQERVRGKVRSACASARKR